MSDLPGKVAKVFFGIIGLVAVLSIAILIIENFYLILAFSIFAACFVVCCIAIAVIWQLGEILFNKIKEWWQKRKFYSK